MIHGLIFSQFELEFCDGRDMQTVTDGTLSSNFLTRIPKNKIFCIYTPLTPKKQRDIKIFENIGHLRSLEVTEEHQS